MRRYFWFVILLLSACTARTTPTPNVALRLPEAALTKTPFAVADGSRPLAFPDDFGPHPDFRTEWWYYTGNLDSTDGRHFGFELTIFRVTLRPTTASDSTWQDGQLYFAHFALSDIANGTFHAFQRFSRRGPGLAGAQSTPYHVWLEDWEIEERTAGVYHLFAAQEDLRLDLLLNDRTGPVLHGQNGYSRKGADPTNASYYYSLPRLQAQGTLQTTQGVFQVNGLAWMDHEFSTSVLGEDQIGWDWFSLQFDDGSGLMLYQLRRADGSLSPFSSGTWIFADGSTRALSAQDFTIQAQQTWRSPHTGGVYPSAWQVSLPALQVDVQVTPWMADQELVLAPTAYWEGAVRVQGTHSGNGYVELTGYAGELPLP